MPQGWLDHQVQGSPSTPYKLISAATTNATSVSAVPCSLAWYFFGNQNTAVRYLKLYDKASAPTVGTDVPKLTLPLPGGASGHISMDNPILFANGLAFALTTGVLDSDTGAVAINEIVVNLAYLL